MSSTDQQGGAPLTRKQLREIRLTGSTPVITADEAAAAAEAAPAPAAPPAPVLPRAAAPVDVAPAPTPDAAVDLGAVPLTRRQAREQERIRTASVPVVTPADLIAEEERTAAAADGSDAPESTDADRKADAASSAAVIDEVPVTAPEPETTEEPSESDESDETVADEDISEVEDSAPSEATDAPEEADAAHDEEPADADDAGVHPVQALLESQSTDTGPASLAAEELVDGEAADADDSADSESDGASDLDELVASDEADESDEADDESTDDEPLDRATVSETFGSAVVADEAPAAARIAPSFDELLTTGDTTGSQHSAPSALIFNTPATGSLSGPVAATGEMLVTGSYDLPSGFGSRGFAEGVADGSDVDAVLIDGELPPTSSPTPIAASSAVSTIKPAGEVIRPPAPDKGNKLMLTLAIVAGGLALVLAAVVVIAFTTNVI